MDLSRQAGLPLPADTPEDFALFALIREPVANLEEALSRFAFAQGCIRTYEGVRRIAAEAVEDLGAENVRLAELRFSPEFMCEPAGLDWDGAMESVVEGVTQAASSNDVEVGLVAIFSRDYGRDSARRTVDFAVRHHDELVGFDIAGAEIGFPPRNYVDLVRPIRDAGLGLTTHYGESGGPEYPAEAVQVLGSDRLGHGLSVARDPNVTRLVIERGVTLEMCPTSNWLTKGVARVEDHPALRLLREGVRVALGSDDPGLMGIDLTHEFEVARHALGFTDEDFRTATRNALAACFVPDDRKDEVRGRHFGWLDAPSAEAPTPA
jgi:adenosine deaminase